jgi:hypothetical protein
MRFFVALLLRMTSENTVSGWTLMNDFKDSKYSMAAISWKCVAIRSEAEQQAWP